MSKIWQIQHGGTTHLRFAVTCLTPRNTSQMCSRNPSRSISQTKAQSISVKTISSQANDGDSGQVTEQKPACATPLRDDVDLGKLTEEEKKIYVLHQEACQKGESMYKDPATGYAVFTEVFHKERQSCCGNGCRHCPYDHENVPVSKRTAKFNSAFYN